MVAMMMMVVPAMVVMPPVMVMASPAMVGNDDDVPVTMTPVMMVLVMHRRQFTGAVDRNRHRPGRRGTGADG